MDSIAASRCLVERTPCHRQLSRGTVRKTVCFGGGKQNVQGLGRGEKVRKIALKSQLQGLEGALDSAAESSAVGDAIGYHGVHHVGLLCSNLERSLEFYQGLLAGLKINPDRPNKKLPYRGAWLWIGSEMIHLMELPNPDPSENRPEHGGRDRHFCIGIEDLNPLIESLDQANVEYTKSMSGRPAVFFRDPDMNCLECVEMSSWR